MNEPKTSEPSNFTWRILDLLNGAGYLATADAVAAAQCIHPDVASLEAKLAELSAGFEPHASIGAGNHGDLFLGVSVAHNNAPASGRLVRIGAVDRSIGD